MDGKIREYIDAQADDTALICERLQAEITENFSDAENKVWHAHPVWFLDGNPIVGYSVQKPGVRLMFWSGADFDESDLQPGTGKFKDASVFYQSVDQINSDNIARWCEKARHIQWDYKNLIKHRGRLEKLS